MENSTELQRMAFDLERAALLLRMLDAPIAIQREVFKLVTGREMSTPEEPSTMAVVSKEMFDMLINCSNYLYERAEEDEEYSAEAGKLCDDVEALLKKARPLWYARKVGN